MKQTTLNLDLSLKRTRKREFLEQMEHVVPWAALVKLIAPHYPQGNNGRPPFPLETMLRIHFTSRPASTCGLKTAVLFNRKRGSPS